MLQAGRQIAGSSTDEVIDFFNAIDLPAAIDPGAISVSNGNEYLKEKYFRAVERGRRIGPKILKQYLCADCLHNLGSSK
jgi:hypothetical protein